MTDIDDHDDIATLVNLYAAGVSKGDAAMLRQAFHPDARMFGKAGSQRVDLGMEQFFEVATQHPLDSDGQYRARLISVNRVGDAAVALVAEDGCFGKGVSFLNFLSLARIGGAWRIVNKTFTHTGGTMPDEK